MFAALPFMPHGHCYLWEPSMVWLQVLSNGLIAVAYISISTTLAYLVYRLRDEIPFKTMYLAFGAFIVLCGATHILDIVVIWEPAYWFDGALRGATAIVSAATALLLPTLIPHAHALARGSRAARDRGIELEHAVHDLSTMYEQTKELEKTKSQFFANVSHELRTPLTLILGPAERLARAQNLSPEQRRDLELILNNGRALHKHVEDLLTAAKLDAGKLKPSYMECDLAHLAKLTAMNFDGLAEDRKIAFIVKTPGAIPAELDPGQVERIAVNLISNAFKFTPSGGCVRVEVTTNTHGAKLHVADSGPGIPLKDRETIFERFRQLDGGTARQQGGTGLGLAIARELAATHGGAITVGEAPEGGALFTVELPLKAPKGAEIRRGAEALGSKEQSELAREALFELRQRVDALPAVRDKGKPLVLVVEDNPDMNRFVAETLGSEHQCISAFDGQSGFDEAMALAPDAIVSDVMMPGMSGDQLVSKIRAEKKLDGTPIILLTAKADDELRVRLLREGAQDYVMKPFSAEELRARVGNLITLKRARDVLYEAKVEAESAKKELEAFSYSVAHDLRAPLRGLDGFSKALLEDYSDRLESDGQDYLNRIRAAAQKMGRLIDDLLNLSRMTRAELRPEAIDLAPVADAIVGRLRQSSPDRKAEIAIPHPLSAVGDPRLLEIALENILGNAWKFTRDREVARIEIGTRHDREQPTYFVRDNGVGFDMSYRDKLFLPFQRLHSANEFDGTGIGLATVQRIIQRHGGEVWAEGAIDRGTTVYFTLAPKGSAP